MFKFEFELESIDELFAIGELLIKIDEEYADDFPLMQVVNAVRGDYEFALTFGYDGVEDCIIKRKGWFLK
jgi:hypothetical protein